MSQLKKFRLVSRDLTSALIRNAITQKILLSKINLLFIEYLLLLGMKYELHIGW